MCTGLHLKVSEIVAFISRHAGREGLATEHGSAGGGVGGLGNWPDFQGVVPLNPEPFLLSGALTSASFQQDHSLSLEDYLCSKEF